MSHASAGGRGRPATVPREVRIASALLTALGAVLILNAAVALFFREDLQAAAQEDVGALLEPGQVNAVLIVASALLLLLGGLLALAGAQIRQGRQWARVLAFVSAGILILVTAIGALAGAGLLAVVLLGAAVGVVALLMQAAVAPFFEPGPAPADQPGPYG
jgi:hypothetical protein